MEKPCGHPLLLLTFCFLLAGGASAASPPRFIITACQNTLYPDDCVSSLSRHAADVGGNSTPRRLACVALQEALNRAKSASASVSRLSSGNSSRRPSASRQDGASAVLSDCVNRLSNCEQVLSRSLWQMQHLGRAGTARYLYSLSNVQTWVSAALTDQTACLDGFPSPGVRTHANDAVKSEVVGVSRITSIVLSLLSRVDGAQQ